MKNNDDYIKTMNEIWKIKDLIYKETKGMDKDEFLKYFERNIGDLKKKFKNRYSNSVKFTK